MAGAVAHLKWSQQQHMYIGTNGGTMKHAKSQTKLITLSRKGGHY